MRVRSWRDMPRFQNVVEMDVWEIPDPSTLQKVKILGVEFVAWEDLKEAVTRYSCRQEVSEQYLDHAGIDIDSFISYILEGMAREITREMLRKLMAESPEIAGKIAEKPPEKRPMTYVKTAPDSPEKWLNLPKLEGK